MNQNTVFNMDIIKISEYNYALPEEKIAKYPLEQRDESKLLIYKNNKIWHTQFKALSSILESNDLLVINNTKVIHSRLLFRKNTGAIIEVFCLEPYEPSDYSLSLQSVKSCKWKCLVGNLKRWKEGPLFLEIETKSSIIVLEARKSVVIDSDLVIEFSWDISMSFAQILELIGETPIPPYLNRPSQDIDKLRYQTIYSKHEGSVAAPTAGLHFTQDVLDKIIASDIHMERITLHVGAGTFKPVQTEKVADHEMHSEFFEISKPTLVALKNNKDIISVGTTTLRTLESIYWLGIKIQKGLLTPMEIPELMQWEAYHMEATLSYQDSIEMLLQYMERYQLECFAAKTSIIILPGYKIRSTKALITNFHQPKSTLLLLVSAFIGEDWKRVYAYALQHEFRFLSYGDSSILFRSLDIQGTMV
jgi:S-adenosylmethionine:tRNA ribosyltransferase-isomerase